MHLGPTSKTMWQKLHEFNFWADYFYSFIDSRWKSIFREINSVFTCTEILCESYFGASKISWKKFVKLTNKTYFAFDFSKTNVKGKTSLLPLNSISRKFQALIKFRRHQTLICVQLGIPIIMELLLIEILS